MSKDESKRTVSVDKVVMDGHAVNVSASLQPRPSVELIGQNGNAYAIIGSVKKALKKAGCSDDHIASYVKKAMQGDYDNLLRVTMEYVDVE